MKSYTSSFKFDDIPGVLYPVYSFTQDGRVFNFKRSVTNTSHSRLRKLKDRSIQELKFDVLVDIGYFNEKVIKEFPIIIEGDEVKPGESRSYYLIDYYIPSKSLCIELDSSLHNKEMDEIKDSYLKSLGLNVLRESDFHIDTKSKLDKISKFISSLPYKDTPMNFSYTFKKLNSLNGKVVKRRGLLYFMKPKWRNIVESLDKNLDNDIINSIVNNTGMTIHSSLDELSKILPSRYRSLKDCQYIVNYMRNYGINIKLE